jgi:hypothetical protein
MSAAEVRATDALAQITNQAGLALDALADEREGDFTRAVLRLEQQATALAQLVRSW